MTAVSSGREAAGSTPPIEVERQPRTSRAAVAGRWEHEALHHRLRDEVPLLLVWAQREFRVRYRQSGLGVVWSIVQPLATLAIYGAVLSGVLHVGSDGYPYISFAYAGLVPWSFTSTAIGTAFPSLMSSGAVVGKVYFPREVVPMAVVGASVIDLAIATAIFFIILVVQGVGLSVHILALIPVFGMIILWVAAISVLGALWTVFVRDLRYAVGLLLQLLFFATPIMYPPHLVHGALKTLTQINPLAVTVTAIRAAALAHHWPDWSELGLFAAIGAAFFLVVIAYTRSVEPRIVDVL